MNYHRFTPILASLAGLLLGAASGALQGDGKKQAPETAPLLSASGNNAHQIPSMGDARTEAFNEALGTVNGKMDLRQLARLGEALSVLSPEQIPALLDRVESETSPNVQDRMMWLFRWWQQHDPSRAGAWIRKRLELAAQDGPLGHAYQSSNRYLLFQAWAKASPQDALEFAKLHRQSGLAEHLLSYAMEAWPDQSGRGRMALLLEFPAGNTRQDVLMNVLAKWTTQEPAAAIAAAQALPDDGERKKAIAAVLREWAKQDPDESFSRYQALGVSDVKLAARLLCAVVEKNPTRAVEWLAEIDPAHVAQLAPELVSQWAQSDPAAAFTWAIENGVSLATRVESESRVMHNSFNRTMQFTHRLMDPFSNALENKPEAVLAWLQQLPPGAERDRMIERTASTIRDLDQALALFSRLPPEAASRTASTIAQRFSEDPTRLQEAVKWAASLPPGPVRTNAWAGFGSSALHQLIPMPPPGPDRDAMLSGRVLGNGLRTSPIPSLETAMQISDPQLRRDMLDEAVEHFSTQDSLGWAPKALEWLEKSDVPEEWKRRWRAQVAQRE
ncbi:MAG: hypothetical protein EOP84_14695 [Verrucomicrobiaceae bacterium]|nr:MAG: hypothetical protein EOP84_14695 [Verrucomicrobiaceae bacterium]